MALGVERDDLELERLALVDDVARMGDALMAQLADVDQALEPVADADESAEVDELGDRAVDDVADLEVGDRRVPRVGLKPADREADAAALVVDVDDLGLDLFTDAVAGLGVVDLVPRELALVDEAVDAAEVDEDAERRDRADRAGDLLADLQAAEQLVALLAPLLVERHLLREDQAVGLAVDLEDLEPELAADERLELLGDLLRGVARLIVLGAAREVDDLADRHEAADAAVDDEAALVVVDDRRLDDRARLELLLHRAPLALESGAAEREDDVALRRLRLEHVHEDRVADVERGLGLAVAPEELAVADDAFALGADVDKDLVLVDANDGPSTTSPCLKLLMSVSCSASSSSIVVGSGRGRARARRHLVVGSAAAGASSISSALTALGGRLGVDGLGGVSTAPAAAARLRGGSEASAAPRSRWPRRFGGRRGLGGLGGRARRLGGLASAASAAVASAAAAPSAARLGRPPCLDGSGGCLGVLAPTAPAVGGVGWWRARRRRQPPRRLFGAWSRRWRRLRLRRGPALLLFGQRLVTPDVSICPENQERPERSSGRVRAIRWSVVIDSAVRSFVRRMAWRALQLSARGRESLARASGYNRAPCPNCPI